MSKERTSVARITAISSALLVLMWGMPGYSQESSDPTAEETRIFIARSLEGCEGRTAKLAKDTLLLAERMSGLTYTIQLDQLSGAQLDPPSGVTLLCGVPGCMSRRNANRPTEVDSMNEYSFRVCGEGMPGRVKSAVDYFASKYGKRTPF